jgi:hypothetical protein
MGVVMDHVAPVLLRRQLCRSVLRVDHSQRDAEVRQALAVLGGHCVVVREEDGGRLRKIPDDFEPFRIFEPALAPRACGETLNSATTCLELWGKEWSEYP